MQGVDVARCNVQLGDRARHVVGAEFAMSQVLPQPRDEAGMGFRSLTAEVGQPAHLPEAAHHAWGADTVGDLAVIGKQLEHGQIDGLGCGSKLGPVRTGLKV